MTTAMQIMREFVVGKIFNMTQNDEVIHERLQAVARQAVVNDVATGLTFEDYEMAMAGRGQTDRSEYARAIAPAVRDEFQEILDEILPEDETNIVRLIVIELVDFGDSAQWEMFADLYLPDVNDMRGEFFELVSITEFIRMIGKEESDRDAVISWLNTEEPLTREEAEELAEAWQADTERIARETE